MPYIKSPFGVRSGIKVFHTPGICWKCGKDIPIGTMNWTYNTQVAGKYSHQDCAKVSDEAYAPPVKPKLLKPKAGKIPTKPEQETYKTYNAASDVEKALMDSLDKLKSMSVQDT